MSENNGASVKPGLDSHEGKLAPSDVSSPQDMGTQSVSKPLTSDDANGQAAGSGPPQTVPYTRLYCPDKLDIVALCLGTLGALANAPILPGFVIFFGDVRFDSIADACFAMDVASRCSVLGKLCAHRTRSPLQRRACGTLAELGLVSLTLHSVHDLALTSGLSLPMRP